MVNTFFRCFWNECISDQFYFPLFLESLRANEWRDPSEPDIETIPDEVLLETPAFPSALQVFASVQGLALLAEHLPLLYPEITRQVGPTESPKEVNAVTGLGQDWVTVESAEEIYEVGVVNQATPFPASFFMVSIIPGGKGIRGGTAAGEVG